VLAQPLATVRDRHPEAPSQSGGLEGRRPGCNSGAVHPSRLACARASGWRW